MAEEDALYAFQHKCGVLTTPMPEDFGEIQTVEQIKKRAKWDNDDYVCRGLILNGMFDFLFDIYQNVETSKELWDTLEAKYMAEDASSKKFLVSCIIDKLPPSWKDFKHTLKHLKEELTLIELGSHLRIEESLRMQDSDKPKGNNVAGLSVVNMVEHNNCSRANGSITKGSEDGSSNPLKGHTFFVQDNDVAWWIDSGATVHVCKDRCWFKTYESLNDGSILYMGNESTALVHECGCVDISDLCDLHATPSLGNKKYFVTFIDNASRRWQKKMHFMLFSMSVVYVLTTPLPEDKGENPTVEQVRRRAKWDNDDYVCRGLILN
nr:hypothetical protein [Tanacetum cinerariifolium]